MVSRIWFCVLLMAVVCGCEAENKTANMEMNTANMGMDTAKMEVETTKPKTETAKAERQVVKPNSNIVKLETSKGDIVIKLNESAAPVTVKNFLRYVNEGFYNGLIFHRVISGFMIQGGGLTPDLAEKKAYPPIVNEASNGLRNDRGTIAMARTPSPDSATCQFFINHRDNTPLNYRGQASPGYAVFGKVIEGMDVVDAIASVKTTTRVSKKGVPMKDVPVEPVVIKSARVVSK